MTLDVWIFRRFTSGCLFCSWPSFTGSCCNVWVGQRTDDCYVSSQWLSGLPKDQRNTIRPFPIGSAKTKWLFGAWNASRDHSPGDQIIQGVVPGRSTRSFLTNKAVQSLHIDQGPTVTFMWHAKSQAKPLTYSDSHCFVVKPQPNIIILYHFNCGSCYLLFYIRLSS